MQNRTLKFCEDGRRILEGNVHRHPGHILRPGEAIIVFDGNIQSLPWDFIFDEVQGRSVHVDSDGIIEALRNIYHADALANELTGAQKKAAGAK